MAAETKTYTLAECEQHTSEKDCWLIIHGKVRGRWGWWGSGKVQGRGDYGGGDGGGSGFGGQGLGLAVAALRY